MQKFKEHIIFKMAWLVLAVALLVPSIVKFSHVFNHHQHEICYGENHTHLHKLDAECLFYKFKLTSPFTFPSAHFEVLSLVNNHQTPTSSYSFLIEYQQLHFTLRGPPQFELT